MQRTTTIARAMGPQYYALLGEHYCVMPINPIPQYELN
jgi:hypothetical protein